MHGRRQSMRSPLSRYRWSMDLSEAKCCSARSSWNCLDCVLCLRSQTTGTSFGNPLQRALDSHSTTSMGYTIHAFHACLSVPLSIGVNGPDFHAMKIRYPTNYSTTFGHSTYRWPLMPLNSLNWYLQFRAAERRTSDHQPALVINFSKIDWQLPYSHNSECA